MFNKLIGVEFFNSYITVGGKTGNFTLRMYAIDGVGSAAPEGLAI